MASSDERRALAERLRRASACGEGISCCTVDKALGLRYDNDFFGDVFTCESVRDLADLIDPTCKVMEVPDNDELKIRVVSGFMCKRCGHEAIVERNCDGSAEPPRFCPHCGARVTSGGDIR